MMKGKILTPNERIRELRLASGYRQADLADLVGCSGQVISNIERGVSRVSADMAKQIADALQMPLEEILQDGQSLSQDEVTVLSLYRQLPEKQKKLMIDIMDDLLDG